MSSQLTQFLNSQNTCFMPTMTCSQHSTARGFDEWVAWAARNGKRIPSKTEMQQYLATTGNAMEFTQAAWVPVGTRYTEESKNDSGTEYQDWI
jgi:hypothetical protein